MTRLQLPLLNGILQDKTCGMPQGCNAGLEINDPHSKKDRVHKVPSPGRV